MAKKLRDAKREGDRMRMRITATCLITGSLVMAFSFSAGAVFQGEVLANVGRFTGPSAVMLILASVLPTDKRYIYRVTKLGIFIAVTFTLLLIGRILRESTPRALFTDCRHARELVRVA